MSCSKGLQTFFGQVAQNDKLKPQKTIIMKFLKKNYQHLFSTKKYVIKSILLSSILFSTAISCSKEDNGSNGNDGELVETGGQVLEGDFEAYQGEIGVVLDARPLARKGYKPTQVTINVNASSGNFSETVPIDEYTIMGQLKIPVEDLNEDAKTELTSGVDITTEYKDENGTVIFTEGIGTISLQANPNVRLVNASGLEETTENQTLTLSEDTTYYIQRMNEDGTPDSGAWRYLDSATYDYVISANVTDFNANESDRGFDFISIPEEMNTFAIRHKASGRFVQATLITVNQTSYTGSFVAPNLSTRSDFSEIQNASDYDNFKYRFDQLEDGSFSIVSIEWGDNFPLKQIPGFGLSFSNWVNNSANGQQVPAEPRSWRIVSTNVQWTITNIGTAFEDPILPPAETGLSFNSTLTNCGNGSLTQTVGVNTSETNTNTVGWEESLSMSTSNTVDVSATVSVGFEASFFGTGASYDMSVTAGYSHSWSSTSESSNWGDETREVQTSLSSERTVTVPSGSASLVYDVYQFYPNTRVNFAQRLRVSASDGNYSLTGNEIKTLFDMTGFNGVITSIEPTSIVITLKGTVILDKIIETESNVQDVPANCN